MAYHIASHPMIWMLTHPKRQRDADAIQLHAKRISCLDLSQNAKGSHEIAFLYILYFVLMAMMQEERLLQEHLKLVFRK